MWIIILKTCFSPNGVSRSTYFGNTSQKNILEQKLHHFEIGNPEDYWPYQGHGGWESRKYEVDGEKTLLLYMIYDSKDLFTEAYQTFTYI